MADLPEPAIAKNSPRGVTRRWLGGHGDVRRVPATMRHLYQWSAGTVRWQCGEAQCHSRVGLGAWAVGFHSMNGTEDPERACFAGLVGIAREVQWARLATGSGQDDVARGGSVGVTRGAFAAFLSSRSSSRTSVCPFVIPLAAGPFWPKRRSSAALYSSWFFFWKRPPIRVRLFAAWRRGFLNACGCVFWSQAAASG